MGQHVPRQQGRSLLLSSINSDLLSSEQPSDAVITAPRCYLGCSHPLLLRFYNRCSGKEENIQQHTLQIAAVLNAQRMTEGTVKELKTDIAKKAQDSTCFACAEEAAALLNCVADKKYNDMRCLSLMKKLRACVERQVRVIPAHQYVCWS